MGKKELREKFGIPWWHIALEGGLAVVAALSGVGVLQLSGTAARLLGAGRTLVRSIELGGDAKTIKENIAKEKNPEVESIVKELYGKGG